MLQTHESSSRVQAGWWQYDEECAALLDNR